jgi:ribosome hibernation promoting factor
MQIAVKGRNIPVDDDLRERIEKKFAKTGRQVSDLARLEVELFEETNPAIRESQVAEATLFLKGVTLRAHEASETMGHSINEVAEEIARQVKRHREKRRRFRKTSKAAARAAAQPGPAAP